MNKFPDFLSLTLSYSPHVIGVTETWFHNEICDAEISLPGFNVIRSDRIDGRGGGVALYLHSDLKFSVLDAPSQTESVWCKVYFETLTFVVGVFYRPPNLIADSLVSLSAFVQEIVPHSPNLICMGDFNVPDINWTSLSPLGHASQLYRETMNFSLTSGLKQIVSDATRGTAILDLVFFSPRVCDYGYACTVVDGISDHKAVFASISCPVPKARYIYSTFRNMSHADDIGIIDALSTSFAQFEAISIFDDVDTLTNFSVTLFQSASCVLYR